MDKDMRILYFSDIHIEVRGFRTRISPDWIRTYPLCLGPDLRPFVGGADLVALAGDIGDGIPGSRDATLDYASQVHEFLGAPVVAVLGNKEFHGLEFDEARQRLMATAPAGVSVLDRSVDFFNLEDRELRVLGATLWTDYAVLGDPVGAMGMARYSVMDHRRIARAGGRAFTPTDALREHEASRKWLEVELAKPHGGPTLIVTHHVPHPSVRNPRFSPTDPLSPAFQSDLSDLLYLASAKQVEAWIFGHHHHCVDAHVLGVRLLSAQLGFPNEQTGWSGPGLLTI